MIPKLLILLLIVLVVTPYANAVPLSDKTGLKFTLPVKTDGHSFIVEATGNLDVTNLDFNKEFVNTFSEKIQSSDIRFINQTLKDLHEADVANLIENLSNETRVKLIELEEFNIDPDISPVYAPSSKADTF